MRLGLASAPALAVAGAVSSLLPLGRCPPAVRVLPGEKEGTLDLATEPTGAEVFAGVSLLGKTPLRALKLPAGKYTLRIVHPDADELTREIDLREGESLDLGRLTLPPTAFIDLTTVPAGVTATIEGRDAKGMVVHRSGVVTVTFSKAKHRDQAVEMTLLSGKVGVPVLGPWLLKPGWLDFGVIPADAGIAVDGKPVGRESPFARVEAGAHRVRLSRRWFRPVPEFAVTVGPDESVPIAGVKWERIAPIVPAVPDLWAPSFREREPGLGVELPDGFQRTEDGRIYCDKDGAELVMVPAGEFLMGIDGEPFPGDDGRAGPRHKVYVSSFLIDRHEVTRAQARRFCKETGWNLPDCFCSGSDELLPVTASYPFAKAYAKWAGRRLPTEAEWEKAARGVDGRQFPWGNEDVPNLRNGGGLLDSFEDEAPVGSFALGTSPFGCFDMAGNVSEWCSDWFSKTYYSESPPRDPQGPRTGSRRVMRGGDFICSGDSLKCWNRGWMWPEERGNIGAGFRLVRSLP